MTKIVIICTSRIRAHMQGVQEYSCCQRSDEGVIEGKTTRECVGVDESQLNLAYEMAPKLGQNGYRTGGCWSGN